jgi:hypothetical protein
MKTLTSDNYSCVSVYILLLALNNIRYIRSLNRLLNVVRQPIKSIRNFVDKAMCLSNLQALPSERLQGMLCLPSTLRPQQIPVLDAALKRQQLASLPRKAAPALLLAPLLKAPPKAQPKAQVVNKNSAQPRASSGASASSSSVSPPPPKAAEPKAPVAAGPKAPVAAEPPAAVAAEPEAAVAAVPKADATTKDDHVSDSSTMD